MENNENADERLMISPDQRYLLTHSRTGDHRLWEIQSGRLVGAFQATTKGGLVRSYMTRNHVFAGPSISYDSKYLITESTPSNNRMSFSVWDVESGEVIKELDRSHDGEQLLISTAMFLPGNYIYSYSTNHSKNKYQFSLVQLEGKRWKEVYFDYDRNAPGNKETSYVSLQAVSPDMAYFACGTTNGKVLLFNAGKIPFGGSATLKPERIFDLGENLLQRLCISADGKYITAADASRYKIWELRSGKLIKEFKYPFYEASFLDEKPFNIYQGGLSQRCSCLFVETKGDIRFKVFDARTGELRYQLDSAFMVKRQGFLGYDYNAISEDGRKIFDFLQNSARIYGIDIEHAKLLPSIQLSDLYSLSNTVYNPQTKELYIGKLFNDALILEMETGKIKTLRKFSYFADTAMVFGNEKDKLVDDYLPYDNLVLSNDHKYLISYDAKVMPSGRSAFLWDAKTKQAMKAWYQLGHNNEGLEFLKEVPDGKKYIGLFERKNKFAVLTEQHDEQQADWRRRTELAVKNIKTGKLTKIFPFLKEEANIQYKPYAIKNLLSADGKFLYTLVDKAYVLVHNTLNGKLIRKLMDPSFADDTLSVPFSTSMVLSSDEKKMFMDVDNKKDNYIAVFDLLSGRMERRFARHSNSINSLLLLDNDRLMVSCSKDKRVKFWDMATGKLLVTMVASGNDYVLFTPEGYYMASKNGTSLFHYIVSGRVYLSQQFDMKFNRPDKVLQALGTVTEKYLRQYELAYQKRMQAADIKYADVTLDNTPKLSLSVATKVTSGGQLKVAVKGSDALYPLKSLKVWVNGVPEIGFSPKPLKGARSVEMQLDIRLSKGHNIVEAVLVNDKGVGSLHELLEINVDGKTEKPNLFVIALGAGRYRSLDRLNYAAKDAHDFCLEMAKKTVDFGKISIDTLIDEQVTQKNLRALFQKLGEANPDDHVYIYYAGHGLRDSEQRYYLGSYDVALSNLNTGIPFQLLQELLANCPSRNKLVLLDACFSGRQDLAKGNHNYLDIKNAVKIEGARSAQFSAQDVDGVNAFDLMQDVFGDLSENISGATVIAATRGNSYAQETQALKNGYFTYALLKAMKGQDADRNADRKVSIRELQEYLEYEVPLLSNGLQVPVSRTENHLNNFNIW